MNRPRESRGSQPSISLKHGRLAHVRSQFSLFRRSPTHKNLPPATFCTSERVFAVLFARRKKYQSVSLFGKFRGFSNLESAHPNNTFPLTKLNPFAASRLLRRPRRHFLLLSQQIFALRAIIGGCAAFLCCLRQPIAALRRLLCPTFCKVQKVGQKTLKLSCLLETWSPCSRPFAILPVSAVSDAQKLATGNFLHVRAESLSLPGRHAPRAVSPPSVALPPLSKNHRTFYRPMVFCF